MPTVERLGPSAFQAHIVCLTGCGHHITLCLCLVILNVEGHKAQLGNRTESQSRRYYLLSFQLES